MTDSSTDTDNNLILRAPILDIISEWLLYVSAALIVGGLIVPSVHKPAWVWGFDGQDYNIFGVLGAMWDSKQYPIAVVVCLFSIVFPLLKTLMAAVLFRFGNRASKKAAQLMQFLGKWSMLDVFLVAFLVGMTQLAATVTIKPLIGLYLFAAGVILNNLATARLSFARAH